MPAKKTEKVADALKHWFNSQTGEQLDTFTVIVRPEDRRFVKVFPAFTERILDAMRRKKLQGAGDVIFYFLDRLQGVRVNGTVDEIEIRATGPEIAQATGKSIRAVRQNVRTLLDLRFLIQPHRGEPYYYLPPDYSYRGVLKKLRSLKAQEAAIPMDTALNQMKEKKPPKTILPPTA